MIKGGICFCAAALLLTVPMGTAWADDDSDGTGLSIGREQPLKRDLFGWYDTLEEHQDYVEDFGIGECVFCHEPDLEGYSAEGAPGCRTCHGPEWDDDGDSDAYGELSAGNQLMNVVLFGSEDAWPSPLENHRDYVDEFGISSCGGGCHAFDMGGKPAPSTFSGPGCLSCHGVEWDDDADSDSDDSDSDSD